MEGTAQNTSVYDNMLAFHWMATARYDCELSTTYQGDEQKKVRNRGTKQPWRSQYNAICKDWIAKHKRTTCNNVVNRSSKTRSQRQSQKKTILKHFLKRNFKKKSPAPNLKKICWRITIPWCSYSNTMHDVQHQKTIVLRTREEWRKMPPPPQKNTLLRSRMRTGPYAHAQNNWKYFPRRKKTPLRSKMHCATHRRTKLLGTLRTPRKIFFCAPRQTHVRNDWKWCWRHKKTPPCDPKRARRHVYTKND